MKRNPYYPIFTDLRGRRCVVVGGGAIAEHKVSTLLSYGAQVTVISPALTRRLRNAAHHGQIAHVSRRFRPADLRGAWLVCAATSDQPINEAVSRAATRLRVFVNVVDQPRLCTYVAPSIVSRGALTIAISTGGASPAMAKQLRRSLEQQFGQDYAKMLDLLEGLRPEAKRRLTTYDQRKRYFEHVLKSRVFSLVRAGRSGAALREALALLEQESRQNGKRH